MMSLLFLIRREFRDRYPTRYAFVGEAFGLLASLVIYGFTSRAFARDGMPFGGQSLPGARTYFEYLVIGETALFLPLALFGGIARSFRQSVANGTWEAMLCQPIRPSRAVSLLGTAMLPLEIARIAVTLALAALLFGLSLSGNALASVLAALLLQLAAIPAFLGLGMATVGILCRFGRGDHFLSYLGSGAAILAGAYFPVSVLPPWLRQASAHLSPFTTLLEGTRQVLGGDFSSLGRSILVLATWSLGCWIAGAAIFRTGVEHTRRNGLEGLAV